MRTLQAFNDCVALKMQYSVDGYPSQKIYTGLLSCGDQVFGMVLVFIVLVWLVVSWIVSRRTKQLNTNTHKETNRRKTK